MERKTRKKKEKERKRNRVSFESKKKIIIYHNKKQTKSKKNIIFSKLTYQLHLDFLQNLQQHCFYSQFDERYLALVF